MGTGHEMGGGNLRQIRIRKGRLIILAGGIVWYQPTDSTFTLGQMVRCRFAGAMTLQVHAIDGDGLQVGGREAWLDHP